MRWEDTTNVHGWHKEPDNPEPSSCRSVGYVVRDDAVGMTLVESFDDSETSEAISVARYGCALAIPRSAIRKVRELKYAR